MMIGCAEKDNCGVIIQTETLSNKINNALKTNPKSLFIFPPTWITRKSEIVRAAHHPGPSRRVNSNNQISLDPVYPACPFKRGTCLFGVKFLLYLCLWCKAYSFGVAPVSGTGVSFNYEGKLPFFLILVNYLCFFLSFK